MLFQLSSSLSQPRAAHLDVPRKHDDVSSFVAHLECLLRELQAPTRRRIQQQIMQLVYSAIGQEDDANKTTRTAEQPATTSASAMSLLQTALQSASVPTQQVSMRQSPIPAQSVVSPAHSLYPTIATQVIPFASMNTSGSVPVLPYSYAQPAVTYSGGQATFVQGVNTDSILHSQPTSGQHSVVVETPTVATHETVESQPIAQPTTLPVTTSATETIVTTNVDFESLLSLN